MLGSGSENICACWNGLIRPCGESMNTEASLAAHRVLGRAAGVPGRRAEDVSRGLLGEHVLEQVAEQLQSDVLERERGPVRRVQQVQPRRERRDRRDLVAAERRRG